ncbi:hypothetical protein BgiBS90_015880 [Biomphalaria glabrata]|nr:hypothetical protein BgiBS90_015880 [Biomphalaria glabrata]
MGSQDFVTSTVYGDTIFFSEIMGSKYSVTGPFGHTFSFPDIMGSQNSVTSSMFMATQSPFPRSWISILRYRAILSSPRSMAVKTPSLVVLFMATHNLFFRDHG